MVKVKFALRSLLNKKYDITLIKFDDLFFSPNNNKFNIILNEPLEFPVGEYLLRVERKGFLIEEIVKIDADDSLINIKLPLIKKNINRVDSSLIEKVYDKYRTDKDKCFKCKVTFKGFTDIFECNYCKKRFCAKHRLPEDHKCWGELKSLPNGIALNFSFGKRT